MYITYTKTTAYKKSHVDTLDVLNSMVSVFSIRLAGGHKRYH